MEVFRFVIVVVVVAVVRAFMKFVLLLLLLFGCVLDLDLLHEPLFHYCLT